MIDLSLLKLRFERYCNYKSSHATNFDVNKVKSISLALIKTHPLTPFPSPINVKKVHWNELVSIQLIQTKEEIHEERTDDGANSLATLIWTPHPTKEKSPAEISELDAMRPFIKTVVRAAIAAGRSVEETNFGSAPIVKTSSTRHGKDHIFKIHT